MTKFKLPKFAFLLMLISFVTNNFAQTTNIVKDENLRLISNSVPAKLQSQLLKVNFFEIENKRIQKCFLNKANNENVSRLDSLVLIEPKYQAANAFDLDTSKVVFLYSPLGNTISRTKKNWNGKEWINQYKTIETYDFNLRLSQRQDQSFLDDGWHISCRETFNYSTDGKTNIYIEEQNDSTGWHYKRRITYKYNSSNLEILVHFEDWESGLWISSYKKTVEYDIDDNKILERVESWENGTKIATSTTNCTYTASGKIVSYNYEVSSYGTIGYGIKYVNHFDEQENIILCELKSWENGLWNNSVLVTSDYYPDGKLKSYLYQQWANNVWNNYMYISYVYDDKGNVITKIFKGWEEGELITITKENYTYNNNNQELTTLIESIVGEDSLQNKYRSEYQYNEYGKETYYLEEKWQYGNWVGFERRIIGYDDSGNQINGLAEKWIDGWVPGRHWFNFSGPDGLVRWTQDYYKIDAYYSKVETVDFDNPAEFTLYQNYPNPFNSNTIINFALPHTGFVKLEVFDMLGQKTDVLINEVLSQGTHKVDFQSTDLPSGVYFYRLRTDKFTSTRKMILLK